MPCDRFKTRDGIVVIACSRGRTPRAKRCQMHGCKAEAVYQCDFPIRDLVSLDLFRAYGKSEAAEHTCDKYLCASCAKEVGPDRHHCPGHPVPPS